MPSLCLQVVACQSAWVASTSLLYLYLSNIQLKSLPSGVFDSLTSLRQLYLYDNRLSSLPSGMFRSLTTLEVLWLHANQLGSLPSGVFDSLTSLESLSLTNNTLASLPSGVFDSQTSLLYLYLSNIQLKSLPSGVFDWLKSLTYLDVSNNQLTSLPSGVFDSLTSLKELRIESSLAFCYPPLVSGGYYSRSGVGFTPSSICSQPQEASSAAMEAWVIAMAVLGVGAVLLLGVLLLTRYKHIWRRGRPNVDAGEDVRAPATIPRAPVFHLTHEGEFILQAVPMAHPQRDAEAGGLSRGRHQARAHEALRVAAPPPNTDHLLCNKQLPGVRLKVYEPAAGYCPNPRDGIKLEDVEISAAGKLPSLEADNGHVGQAGAEQTTKAVEGTSFRSRLIPYAELLEATQGFNPSLKIGEGGFGSVFGCRWKHTPVAVKRLEQDEELAKANGTST
eukprot:CAMPEP_0173469054 /NCGR_PEP_ID=MMETSP1357-20121228/77163_1 /TAXON_ID=77926 /ORGANISM="Hemiselmis rufescens, Strain PCC563" /LENGTH=446 /DNA_ID=CAMNT_0014437283 /DNA_START=295 /DNA_END=1631 /DNA_ORIENTATION=-